VVRFRRRYTWRAHTQNPNYDANDSSNYDARTKLLTHTQKIPRMTAKKKRRERMLMGFAYPWLTPHFGQCLAS